MEKTIKTMKQTGLFQHLMSEIINDEIDKDDMEEELTEVLNKDEGFADVYFDDLHTIGCSIIWNELNQAIDKMPKPIKASELSDEDKAELKEVLQKILKTL